MASLAGLYGLTGKRDSALALYGRVLEHADSAGADDLFTAAGSMLGAIPNSPDTAVMEAHCRKAPKKKTPALTAPQVAARGAPAAADTIRKDHVLAQPQYAIGAKTYQDRRPEDPQP